MRESTKPLPRASIRYGPAELYGRDIATTKHTAINRLAKLRKVGAEDCPFMAGRCRKPGGVCSLRAYTQTTDGKSELPDEEIVCTCPYRFHEASSVFSWVGEKLLGESKPTLVPEVPFLRSTKVSEEIEAEKGGHVGKIDMVLVAPDSGGRLDWCALEIQAVYFSGGKMSSDLDQFVTWSGGSLPFPEKNRRPDFRSSGPKRLMPQLQIKVPTLRRWGKKMAVVVDLAFWKSLGEMETVDHISNCDIVWFVVDWTLVREGRRQLVPFKEYYTTLERSVEGLTGGVPVSLPVFENSLRGSLKRRS